VTFANLAGDLQAIRRDVVGVDIDIHRRWMRQRLIGELSEGWHKVKLKDLRLLAQMRTKFLQAFLQTISIA
jgi:hypothetical protein